MENPSKLRRRSSALGSCTSVESGNDSGSSDDESTPLDNTRNGQEPDPSQRSDPFLGLLVMAVLLVLAKGPSMTIWFGSSVVFPELSTNHSKMHPLLRQRGAPKEKNSGSATSNENDIALDGVDSTCANLPPAKFIAIRGERHSATNLFREVTNKNGKFQQPCTRSHTNVQRCGEVLGWKHTFLEPDRDVIDEDLVVAVLVRDAFSWLVSMFNEPYNMIMGEGTDEFGTFIKANYIANECESPAYYHGCKYPIERGENLIQLRTSKYRNWVDFLSPTPENNSTQSQQHQRWSIIKQEDLVYSKQEETIRSFFKSQCIETLRPKFKSVGKIVTNSMQSNHAGKEEILEKFTTDELRYVLTNLDIDFESQVLGYDYSYVEEHIAKRKSGALKYAGPPVLKDHMLKKRLKLIQDNLEGKLPGRDISYEEAREIAYKEKQKRAFSFKTFARGNGAS